MVVLPTSEASCLLRDTLAVGWISVASDQPSWRNTKQAHFIRHGPPRMFWLHNAWAAVSAKYWLLHSEEQRGCRGGLNQVLQKKEKRGQFEESKLAVGLDCLSMLLFKFVGLIPCRFKCKIKVVFLEETSVRYKLRLVVVKFNVRR